MEATGQIDLRLLAQAMAPEVVKAIGERKGKGKEKPQSGPKKKLIGWIIPQKGEKSHGSNYH